jgi:hypothetical protein
VSFIHRSAIEFLENTPEGILILKEDDRPIESRLYSRIKSLVAVVCLRFISSVDNLGSKIKKYQRIPLEAPNSTILLIQDTLVDANANVYHGDGLKLIRICAGVHDSGFWFSSDALMKQPDFAGLATRIGCIEFVQPHVESLQRGSPDGTISQAYYLYLIASAFKGAGPNTLS